MQSYGDWNSETDPDDYVLAGDQPDYDVADKRFDGNIGVCGCCHDPWGTLTRHDEAYNGDVSAKGCTPCDDGIKCKEFNTYAPVVPDDMKWPNAGAWAAFYSFVTCANEKFVSYFCQYYKLMIDRYYLDDLRYSN